MKLNKAAKKEKGRKTIAISLAVMMVLMFSGIAVADPYCIFDKDCFEYGRYKYFCIYETLLRAEASCVDPCLYLQWFLPGPCISVSSCIWGFPFGGSTYEKCNDKDKCYCSGDLAIYKDVDCVGPQPAINRPFFSNEGPQAECKVVKENKVDCNKYDKTYCVGNDKVKDDYYCDIKCCDHGSVLGMGPVKKYCSHEIKIIGKCDEPEPDVPPGNDKPDDNHDVSTSKIASNSTFNPEAPEVAVLFKGFPLDTQKLLASFNEPVSFIDIGLLPDLVNDYPILIIPTGGLYGLDSLISFKSNLERYVKNGGTLIVFSQQHGYEYSALPGGNIGGYGWIEDQSCQHRSLYIDTYHPVLSGQDSVTLDVVVDGYF
ncbi:hypothetical protein KKE78_04810, partial [Patescibacteria group bacterium]|nr:hypothetical protein [Patescibacteria group bacterium]